MYNIKYMGKYEREEQLLTGELDPRAVKYDEPDSISEIFNMGFKLFSPVFIAIFVLIFIRVRFWSVSIWDINFVNLGLALVVGFVLQIAFIAVHEILHAVSFPRKARKEVWVKPSEFVAFVYSSAIVSKVRFIWMSLCPNIILGFIPYLLWMLGIFGFGSLLSNIVIITAMFNIMSGVGDYLNVYLTIKQVPKGGFVQSYGLHSYWIRESSENKRKFD
ncbi:MAG: DUF3267 domain-containing protein [Clostridium sp.]